MNYDNTNLYQVITEEAIMGILVFEESSSQCVYTNRLAQEILELSPDTPMETIKLESLSPSSDRAGFRSFTRELLSLEGLVRDVLIQKADSSPAVIDLGLRKLVLSGKTHYLLMFQDVTIQKKLQREITLKQQEIHNAYQELLVQNKQLKELDLAKDRFIALTTHELRTPLSAIFATSEVLKNKFYDTEEQRDEFIETVYEQATLLLELVNDILDFAKIQAGKMDFFVSLTDLRSVLDLQVSNFEQMAAKKKIKLIYHCPDGEVFCYFDNIRLGEVIANVVNNAIKFTPEGGTVTVSVDVSDPARVRLTVADTGHGIAAENIPKVFNEFETVGNIKTHQKGTGLGMPISKRIMEHMGGSISLESQLKKGTQFFIDIPAKKVLPETEYKERPAQVDDLLSTV